eukprot:TRINITY_DN3062_c0_g1_i2.p1 TRINITY_DN3062_c0_g1~~TRINITY_DN3062_c0_g1_i2.p1  ORF type:complete len:177 (+),score=24.18 TRINITY_DN3062_c0_g1_i2:3-533(+)
MNNDYSIPPQQRPQYNHYANGLPTSYGSMHPMTQYYYGQQPYGAHTMRSTHHHSHMMNPNLVSQMSGGIKHTPTMTSSAQMISPGMVTSGQRMHHGMPTKLSGQTGLPVSRKVSVTSTSNERISPKQESVEVIKDSSQEDRIIKDTEEYIITREKIYELVKQVHPDLEIDDESIEV